MAAAALLLFAGTIGTMRAVKGHPQPPLVQNVATATEVRSGLLLTADGRPLGKMQVYKGTVPVGSFPLHDGSGVFVRIVKVDVGRLRGAKLVTPAGSTLATATFS
jgi:hypothetical protein